MEQSMSSGRWVHRFPLHSFHGNETPAMRLCLQASRAWGNSKGIRPWWTGDSPHWTSTSHRSYGTPTGPETRSLSRIGQRASSRTLRAMTGAPWARGKAPFLSLQRGGIAPWRTDQQQRGRWRGGRRKWPPFLARSPDLGDSELIGASRRLRWLRTSGGRAAGPWFSRAGECTTPWMPGPGEERGQENAEDEG